VPNLREDILLDDQDILLSYRLQHRHATFDEVATLSVEGMSKSAIARAKGIAWNTVHRWLARAAA
jgi:transposase-like protein